MCISDRAYGAHGDLADHLVRLGRSLERSQGADSVMDGTTIRHRSDRKTLRREQEKKIALGHKAVSYTHLWRSFSTRRFN